MTPTKSASTPRFTVIHSKPSLRLLAGVAILAAAGRALAAVPPPPVQNALHFDGSDDLVNTALPAVFSNIPSNDFTVEAWVKPEATIFSRILFAQSSTSNFTSLGTGNTRNVYFYVVANGATYSFATSAVLPANQWTHVAARWTASTHGVEVFFNGVLQPGAGGGSSTAGTNGMMTLGSRPGGFQFYTGSLDEVRVWNTVRTDSQISESMNMRIPSPQAGLEAYYDFNQGTPGGDNAGITELNDYSGNALNGTLTNFALTGATSNWIEGQAFYLWGAGLTAVDDAVTTTGSDATVYPLANDSTVNAGQLTIVSVSDPAVTIVGRSLIVPYGTPSFTYMVADGTSLNMAQVAVTAGAPPANPTGYIGLLRNTAGGIVGSARVNISSRGSASVQMRVGATTASGRISFPSTETSATGANAVGPFSFTRNANGTLDLTVETTGGAAAGSLRSTRATTPPQKLHVALNSIDAGFSGGGYAVANIKASALTSISGLLPDGRPFAATSTLSENGTLAFYALESKRVIPAGFLGGEFVIADLPKTDVTGEIVWSKPTQETGAVGHYLGGVNTVLAGNGSFYSGTIPLDGPATLTLSGGNLADLESNATTVAAGIPGIPLGSLVNWGGVKAAVGKFRAKVKIPGVTRAVTGSGIYLPKSLSAWGYFPGTTEGGKIELRIDSL